MHVKLDVIRKESKKAYGNGKVKNWAKTNIIPVYIISYISIRYVNKFRADQTIFVIPVEDEKNADYTDKT